MLLKKFTVISALFATVAAAVFDPLDKRFCTVNGLRMAYVETEEVEGGGDTFLLLHGVPTSSYLWRNVIPPLAARGKCIAPDLLGMGDSEKLPNSGPESYRVVQFIDFLDKFLDNCVDTSENVVLVLHDWGSAFGFWWAFRHQDRVKGIVHFEALTNIVNIDDVTPEFRETLAAIRTPGVGEELVIEQNVFLDVFIPSTVIRNLTVEEMDIYRAPYVDGGETRRPLLTLPREVPIDGEPKDVHIIVETYVQWLVESNMPKLMVVGDPGFTNVGPVLEFARTFNNQVEASVAGIHFLQEDSPMEIAEAIIDWLKSPMFDDGEEVECEGAMQMKGKKGKNRGRKNVELIRGGK